MNKPYYIVLSPFMYEFDPEFWDSTGCEIVIQEKLLGSRPPK